MVFIQWALIHGTNTGTALKAILGRWGGVHMFFLNYWILYYHFFYHPPPQCIQVNGIMRYKNGHHEGIDTIFNWTELMCEDQLCIYMYTYVYNYTWVPAVCAGMHFAVVEICDCVCCLILGGDTCALPTRSLVVWCPLTLPVSCLE